MTATPELEARHLSVEYETRRGSSPALRGIDLTVQRGAFVAVLGPSGSGKTTLLNAFAGFVRPTSGEAYFRGAPIAAPSVDRAVVFQRHALFPWLDVADNVAFPLKIRGYERTHRRQLIMPLLLRVGLADVATHPVWTLSGGMQQRVGLARALAADPAVLLLDEPLGALDAITREDMQRVLLDLWAGSGKTALLITHDIEEAAFLATHLVVLSERPGTIIGRLELSCSRRIAAGAGAASIRSEPEFAAVKAELRAFMHRRSQASARVLELAS